MADPARYYIEPCLVDDGNAQQASLYVERSANGEWVKWADFEDYKAARRRNSTEDAVTKLGIEVAELRCRIAELEGASK